MDRQTANRVHEPNAEDRSEIERIYSLDGPRSKLLWDSVHQIVREIQEHAATMEYRAKGRNRQQVNAYIRRLNRLLQQLNDHLLECDQNADSVIRRLLGNRLGVLLSHAAVANLTGITPTRELSVHIWDSLEERPRSEIYPALDKELASTRSLVTAQRATKTLRGLILVLSAPLGEFLELERQVRGGKPAKRYRNHVIARLAPVYRQLWEKQPTSSPEGKFVQLCEHLIDLIGLDTDGTDQAVVRILKRLKPV
jgi:hypothetical protein